MPGGRESQTNVEHDHRPAGTGWWGDLEIGEWIWSLSPVGQWPRSNPGQQGSKVATTLLLSEGHHAGNYSSVNGCQSLTRWAQRG